MSSERDRPVITERLEKIMSQTSGILYTVCVCVNQEDNGSSDKPSEKNRDRLFDYCETHDIKGFDPGKFIQSIGFITIHNMKESQIVELAKQPYVDEIDSFDQEDLGTYVERVS